MVICVALYNKNKGRSQDNQDKKETSTDRVKEGRRKGI
jgi:hypothetical protein